MIYPSDSTFQMLSDAVKLMWGGVGKIDIFQRIDTPFADLRASLPGWKKVYKIKTNKHLTLAYKNCLQNRHATP